jgi:hypothetical protein
MKIRCLKYIFLFLGFILFNLCKAQDIPFSKKVLKKAFYESSEKYIKKNSLGFVGGWSTENTDSSYFRADTVKLISNGGNPNNSCHLMEWRFHDNDHSFYLVGFVPCQEPPVYQIGNNNFYNLKIIIYNNKYYILTYNSGRLVDTFLVSNLRKVHFTDDLPDESCYQLTLFREKGSNFRK